MAEVPTCAYRVDAELVELLDAQLGPPLDSYVRGWQVWLDDSGPDGETLEWRLHPPARFRMPRGVNPHDLFDVVLQGIAAEGEDGAFAAGGEQRRLDEVWEVLEVFPAFGLVPGPDGLVAAATAALDGRRPDVAGLADHERLGDLWKGKRGDFSVGRALLAQLGPV
ncbi:MAG: hypothetical protein H0V93_12435 [Euzebyales bacterium]|jgi:hypothetical protein|nr:hypothetical protein [Euzebyales bacterium]